MTTSLTDFLGELYIQLYTYIYIQYSVTCRLVSVVVVAHESCGEAQCGDVVCCRVGHGDLCDVVRVAK